MPASKWTKEALVEAIAEAFGDEVAEKKAEKKPAKKEKKAVFLKVIVERNISKYRRWVNWKKFTYFAIAKEGEKFARIVATDSQLLEDKVKIDGRHVLSISRINTRRSFTDGIKKLLEIEKIGNISKKIDEVLKK